MTPTWCLLISRQSKAAASSRVKLFGSILPGIMQMHTQLEQHYYLSFHLLRPGFLSLFLHIFSFFFWAMRTVIIAYFLLSLYPFVEAIPKFHTGESWWHEASLHSNSLISSVNSHFYNGTACPAVTRPNVLCPVLCVTNQALCPPQFGPDSCPNGLTLCIDGSCSASCSNAVSSVCSCPSQPGVVLKACKSSAFHVDIPNYDPKNMTLQQYEACSAGMNMSSTIRNTWSSLPSNQEAMIWNVCDAPQGMNFPIQSKYDD